jgi:hypothetical protein
MTIGEADGMGRELVQEDVRTAKKTIEEAVTVLELDLSVENVDLAFLVVLYLKVSRHTTTSIFRFI